MVELEQMKYERKGPLANIKREKHKDWFDSAFIMLLAFCASWELVF